MIPRVLIIGRPNVGKSSLFNRLIRRKKALVHNRPGVTRDRIESEAFLYRDRKELTYRLIDTGGVGGHLFDEEIREQIDGALADADLVLLVFDARAGLLEADEKVIRMIRKKGLSNKVPIIGVLNKVDDLKLESLMSDFYSTGIDPLLTVSAENGLGIDELQEEMALTLETKLESFESEAPQAEETKLPRIAIVGKPNVGKSTLLNAILGEKRAITSNVPGTTVDSIDSLVRRGDENYLLLDTAGIRRKSKTQKGIEVLSVVQTRNALARSDLAILVLDGEKGIADQDEKVAGLIEESGCSVVLFLNKWDTQSSNPDFSRKDAETNIRSQMRFLNYAPMVFGSAIEERGIGSLFRLISHILSTRSKKLQTSEFTQWLRREAEIHNPRNAKFFLCHQASKHPPTFVCHVNDPAKVHFSLKRHLVNGIRKKWGFEGTPIRLQFTK